MEKLFPLPFDFGQPALWLAALDRSLFVLDQPSLGVPEPIERFQRFIVIAGCPADPVKPSLVLLGCADIDGVSNCQQPTHARRRVEHVVGRPQPTGVFPRRGRLFDEAPNGRIGVPLPLVALPHRAVEVDGPLELGAFPFHFGHACLKRR